jgi:hypothetical protein
MKSFREHRQDQLDENLARKGAVSVYAARGKRHGDTAVQHFRSAKRNLQNLDNAKSHDEQFIRLATSLDKMLDGMIAMRNQIGSVSAQVTAVSLL